MIKYSFDKYLDNEYGCSYVDEDGCDWENAESWLWCKQLGGCGCGCPSECLNFITNFLKIRDKYSKKEVTYKEREQFQKDLIYNNVDTVIEVLLHWLDSKGVLEHGGSVYGSWINKESLFYQDCLKWQSENFCDDRE